MDKYNIGEYVKVIGIDPAFGDIGVIVSQNFRFLHPYTRSFSPGTYYDVDIIAINEQFEERKLFRHTFSDSQIKKIPKTLENKIAELN